MNHPAMPLPRLPVPPMARVRQGLRDGGIPNVRAETARRLLDAGLCNRVQKGSRIAVTAGSRGMGGFIDILAGIADAVRAAGGEPFIIPAMGSHGGAVPEGQAEILRRLGVSDESLGMPVRATMETLDLGPSECGAIAHLDRIGAEADGIIVLGRVKTHPESTSGLASGLLKMVVVGLGKQAGAQQAHSHGLWPAVATVPKVTMAHARILMGVAVVENAFRHPVHIEAVPPTYDAFLDVDSRLLKLAQQHLAKIPFEQLDVLVVDEHGKSISGTGMDTNVIGHWRMSGGERKPDFRRIVVLSLTPASLGNGLGVGLADFTTFRFRDAYDPGVTYVNLLTATEPDSMNSREGPFPLALPSDREAIEVAAYSALPKAAPRVCRIKSTAELDEMWISEALIPEAQAHGGLEMLCFPGPLDFDGAGNLF